MGVLSQLVQRVREELRKDHKLRSSLDQLKSSDAARQAEEAKKAAQELRKAAQQKGEETWKKAQEVKTEMGSKINPLTRPITEFLSKGVQAIRASEAVRKSKEAAAAVGSKVADSEAVKKAAKTMEELSAENPDQKYTKKEQKWKESDLDRETHAVAHFHRDKTAWERVKENMENSENPIVRMGLSLSRKVGGAMERLGDRVFAETEQSEAVREIKSVEPDFEINSFLRFLHKEYFPDFLDVMNTNDMFALKKYCVDQAYNTLFQLMKAREYEGVRADPRVLDLEEPTLISVKFVNEKPCIVVSFSVQQVYCLWDREGNVLEGAPDDLRRNVFVVALQQFVDEETGTEFLPVPEWRIIELYFQISPPMLV